MTTSTRIRLGLLATLLAGGILAACQAATPSLIGRTFLSVAASENGAPKALVEGTRIRLEFTGNGLGAHAGCNNMGGEYRLENGRLVLGDIFMTEMACEPDLMAQDTWLLDLLGSRPTLTLVGDQLTLANGATVLQLADRRIVEPDRALVGPTWTVDSILSGDAVSSVPEGAVATLLFRDDGTLEVDTSCNTGTARWATVAGGIEVRDLGLTKRGCIGATGQLEAAVVSTLAAGRLAASIEANQLILRAGATGLGLRGS